MSLAAAPRDRRGGIDRKRPRESVLLGLSQDQNRGRHPRIRQRRPRAAPELSKLTPPRGERPQVRPPIRRRDLTASSSAAANGRRHQPMSQSAEIRRERGGVAERATTRAARLQAAEPLALAARPRRQAWKPLSASMNVARMWRPGSRARSRRSPRRKPPDTRSGPRPLCPSAAGGGRGSSLPCRSSAEPGWSSVHAPCRTMQLRKKGGRQRRPRDRARGSCPC